MTVLKASWQFLSLLVRGDRVERAAVKLECEARSVGHGRQFTRQQLGSWGIDDSDFVDRVVLVVSELLTSAVTHARTCDEGESELIGLALAFSPGIAIGVQVTDNSLDAPLATIRPPTTATSGRGLLLVNAVADGWSAAPRQGRKAGGQGKAVWAFFRCPDSAALPRSA